MVLYDADECRLSDCVHQRSVEHSAIIVGHVEAGLVRKHYISPLSTPVTAFTCPLQSEALVVSEKWKPDAIAYEPLIQPLKNGDDLLK